MNSPEKITVNPRLLERMKSQPLFTCWKLTMETPEQGVNYFQSNQKQYETRQFKANNKSTRTTSINFEHVIANWDINPKTAPPPLVVFRNVYVSSIERVKPWFFVTFIIILRHIFPKNFIEFAQVVQKILRNSQSILANFHQFSSIFWILWHCFVTNKLLTSAYNSWCQQFFFFIIL